MLRNVVNNELLTMNGTNTSGNNDKSIRSLEAVCAMKQTFVQFAEFSDCYRALFAKSWMRSSAEILVAVFIVLLNLLVILKILSKQPFKKKLFDRIIIAHCIVDGLTGIADVPFFHIGRVFGYWPLGRTTALMWAAFDNGINSITNLHMLYMTWARFRSIQAPSSYEKEILARSPKLVCLLIWLVGLLIWTLITFSHGVDEFTTSISFKPSLEIALIFATWFTPLAAILPISCCIIVILNRRRRKMARIKRPPLLVRSRCPTNNTRNNFNHVTNMTGSNRSNSHRMVAASSPMIIRSNSLRWRKFKSIFSLAPQSRFQIIIFSYCLQWFPSCIIALIDPVCTCIPANLIANIYWLTFTVCLTDPLVILLFYSNVISSDRKVKKQKRTTNRRFFVHHRLVV